MLAGANGLFGASLALTYLKFRVFDSWTDLAAQEFLDLAHFPAWTADVRRLPDCSLCVADFPEAPSACLLCMCSSEVATVPPHIRSRISMVVAAAAYTYIFEICAFFRGSSGTIPDVYNCRILQTVSANFGRSTFRTQKLGGRFDTSRKICMERHSAVLCRC